MFNTPISPARFAQGWGMDDLIRVPRMLASPAIPRDTKEFLVRAGLPALATHFLGACKSRTMTFCRLSSGLPSVLSEETGGPPLPSSWSRYYVLGDEFFCNGGCWWCLHQTNGHVLRIDIELNDPIEFANTSVAQFAFALLAAVSWSKNCDRTATRWPGEVQRLESELRQLDPKSVRRGHNYWRMYLDFLREEGRRAFFRKGSRAAGRRCLQEGPW
jgi:hypothetical protein